MEKQEEIIMTVNEKKFFLEELKKVPNRDVLKVATWEEILRIAREIDFQAVEQIYFKANGLKLKKCDIPAEELFEANFFFNLSSEFEEQLKTIGEWTVHNVWDLNDSDTCKMLEDYATLIVGEKAWMYDAYFFNLDAVLKYAKSDRPDLT